MLANKCQTIICHFIYSQSNVMDLKATILIAPLLRNSSCSHSRFENSSYLSEIGASEVIQAFFITTLTLAIVGANLVVIIVINCRRYSSFIHPQVCSFHCCCCCCLLTSPLLYITAQIFDNISCTKRFSDRSFNNAILNHSCLGTLLALRGNLLSNSGVATRCSHPTECRHSSLYGRGSLYLRFVSTKISSTFK